MMKEQSYFRKCFESGGYGKLFKKDISNYDNCKELMDEVIGTFGKLDVLVNNAGRSRLDY